MLTSSLDIIQVKTFNGVKIRNLRHLAHLVDSKYCSWVDMLLHLSPSKQALLKFFNQTKHSLVELTKRICVGDLQHVQTTS